MNAAPEGTKRNRRRPARQRLRIAGSAVCLLTVMACLQACTRIPQERESHPVVYLADLLRTSESKTAAPGTSGSFERHMTVTRGGLRLDAVALIAPVTVNADLNGYSGDYRLSFLAAPVFNFGDGMQLTIRLAGKGGGDPLFSRYFDAGRNPGDRKWTEVAVPLNLEGSPNRILEIVVSGGPQGDLVTDWLALARLRLEPGSDPPPFGR